LCAVAAGGTILVTPQNLVVTAVAGTTAGLPRVRGSAPPSRSLGCGHHKEGRRCSGPIPGAAVFPKRFSGVCDVFQRVLLECGFSGAEGVVRHDAGPVRAGPVDVVAWLAAGGAGGRADAVLPGALVLAGVGLSEAVLAAVALLAGDVLAVTVRAGALGTAVVRILGAGGGQIGMA
jgi:hypothetical protein